MPPSRHSSSSHHSSPSRHSSSSHHSSYSSSPSRHSSSSHYSSYSSSSSRYSSSSHYSSSSGGRRSYGNSSEKLGVGGYAQFTRERSHQPSGYHTGIPGYVTPKAYHCKKHDYLYYATSWVDEKTGRSYQSGYYDEGGQHYEQIVIRDPKSDVVQYQCPYCKTEVKFEWKNGPKPCCPNCSAQLKESAVDELEYIEGPLHYQMPQINRSTDWSDIFNGFLKNVVLPFVIFIALISIVWTYTTSFDDKGYTPDDTRTNTSSSNSIYVEEIDRTCNWLREYESYFDATTRCYFWYNDGIDYPSWQYWYEGISSDFGDYGWMEFDPADQQWYIEISDGNWVVLPEKYDTSKLWYIHD